MWKKQMVLVHIPVGLLQGGHVLQTQKENLTSEAFSRPRVEKSPGSSNRKQTIWKSEHDADFDPIRSVTTKPVQNG
jgi:hypothetical protein